MKYKAGKIFSFTFSAFTILFVTTTLFPFMNNSEAMNTRPARSGFGIESMKDRITRLLSAEHVHGEIIVQFRDDIASLDAEVAHSKTGATVIREFKRIKGLQLVKLSKHISLKRALESYLRNPRIEYAEPNYIVHATATPDDTFYNDLWGLHNTGQTGGTADADIDAPEAWNLTTGSSNVVIAVVDTGVAYSHPDLSGNIWTNTGETSCTDGIDNDSNGYIDDCNGWDFIGDDNDPADYAGHGTHVAGTIAAVGNNSSGISGVMWTANIMPLRFLGVSGSGTTAGAISAILYANANGAHVINNSWGGGGFSQALKNAIDASGAVVVCAAGNSGVNNDSTPFYPASYTSSNIISVAATNHNDGLASFSNYGAASVDVGAPGVSIKSTVPQYSYGTPVTLYSGNFEGATGDLPLSGWDRGGTKSSWAVTTGTGAGGTNSLEDSPGKNYLNNTASWAGYMSPVTSVKDNRYTLSFKWKGELETGYDYLDINYSTNGISWDWLDYRTGSTGGSFISDSTTGITVAADLYNNFYFGFGLSSDFSINDDGVYLDDVMLTREQINITGYGYTNYQGTSMASPHVAGVAGLIKAWNFGLTNLEIKDAILNNVDVKSSLTGNVVTDGRINAYTALISVPIDLDGDGVSDDEDGSGVSGDNPCTGGNTVGCDDNCPLTPNADQADMDSDGVGDMCDNCREVANADQRDTNSAEDDNTAVGGEQHYGNICDPDFNNNGAVDLSDYNQWRIYYRQTVPPAPEDIDLNGNGSIGLEDFNIWRQYYRSPPGPGIGD